MSDRSRSRPAAALATSLALAALTGFATFAVALPGNFGNTPDGRPIHARWPDGTTIHVYLPTPPDPPGACANADAQAGIQRWAAALAQRGIQVQFHAGQSPPPGAPNAVGVEWVAPGTFGEDQGEADVHASDTPAGCAIDGATVRVESDEPCGEGMRNLFEHEFGHVLGLADDATLPGQPHNAMDHEVPDDAPLAFSPRDSAEMRSLYGCFATVPPSLPKGATTTSVVPVGDPPVFRYTYVVEWFAGPEIPVFDVTLGGTPAGVVVRALPPGWVVATPPFYLDGHFEPAATATSPELHFYALGPGLDAANPSGTFVLESSAPPVVGWVLPLVDPDEDGYFTPEPALVPGPTTGGVTPHGGEGELQWCPPLPNPFRDATRLRFTVTHAWREGRCDVFDVGGRLLRSLAIGPGGPGDGAVEWDGRTTAGVAVGAGRYFVRVVLDGAVTGGSVVRAR